jgi:Virulence protein RhuM family
MEDNSIVTYTSDSISNEIFVRIEEDMVWLNRNQISILFDRDIKTVGKHINNALKEELSDVAVVANFATTAKDGKVYQVAHYNLDMILSIGYRVKSSRGVEFRKWSNSILKSYLLKGYALQNRVETIEKKLYEHQNKIEQLLNTNLPLQQGIFFEGQLFDAYVFVSDLVKSAKKSIILIDNYVDETVLLLLSKRNANVKATIYTEKITSQFQLDIQKHNAQYEPVCIEIEKKSHDRFLIIDENQVYHIGASIKDLGKKWFAFSRLYIDAAFILSKLD